MQATQMMIVSFLTNFFLSVFKIVVGLIGKSSALLADGMHSFSDLMTDIFAIVGGYLSAKPEDDDHPYGHGRLEYLTSIVIGSVVLFIGLFLMMEVLFSRLMIPSKMVILVSVFTIVIKYALSSFLIKKGERLENQILLASGKESKADVYSSIVVLISSIMMQLESHVHYFIYADKIASMIVGFLIVRTGFLIVKENVRILIGSQEVDTDYYRQIERLVLRQEAVRLLDKLIIMRYGSYYTITMEVSMDASLSLQEAHEQVEKIEKAIKRKDKKAKYIHIHMNPYEE